MFTGNQVDSYCVSQDRSLDEFTEQPRESPTVDTSSSPEPIDESGIDITFSWIPSNSVCASCGEEVERRWQSDRGLVCEACKNW